MTPVSTSLAAQRVAAAIAPSTAMARAPLIGSPALLDRNDRPRAGYRKPRVESDLSRAPRARDIAHAQLVQHSLQKALLLEREVPAALHSEQVEHVDLKLCLLEVERRAAAS